ncbi:MAG: hypothetical protein HYX92_02490 [Chloroflexi bacterium]|nr:hypothetical protein [Chloroflexota bacterium]
MWLLRVRIRLRQVAFVLASLVVLIIVWYLASLPVKEVRADYGGTFVEGVAGAPRSISPLLSQLNDADRDLASLIFSSLTRSNERGEIVPDLAERWDVSLDGRTYTFHLRPGVLWHDGTPFTADDVLYTIETLKNPDFPGVREFASLWNGVSVSKADGSTVALTLKGPYSPFLANTSLLGIAPRHILGKTPVKDLRDAAFNTRPVGTGPFKFKEASAERVMLESDPNYFLGKPYLSAMEVRFFADNTSALAALERKEIHGLLSRQWLSAEEMVRLSGNESLRLNISSRASYSLVFLNLNFPLFKDKAVRQALIYGLDRDKIVNVALAGQGIAAQSPIVPGTWASDSGGARKYDFDPEKAKALLDQAGWRQPEGSIVRKKDGLEFRFALLTNDDRSRIAAGEEVVRQWRTLGVRAELSASSPSRLLRDFVVPRRYQAALYGLDLGYDPDPYPVWHSSQKTEPGFNFPAFANEKADRLLEQARQMTSQGERAKLYAEFQSIFAEEAPGVLLYYPTYVYAVDASVKGTSFGVVFEPGNRFLNVKDWYMRTKEVEVGLSARPRK